MQLSTFTPPTTPAASAARALAAQYHSESMQNHVMRSWLWAEAFAAVEDRREIDHELLYVSAMLHDIGIVPEFDNVTLSYEEAGGHVAMALATGAGWDTDRSRRALDVIIRHNWPSVDPAMDVEGYLLEIGTALDISGARADVLPAAFVHEVLTEYPRLQLATEFGDGVVDQAARKPHTSAHRLVTGGVVGKLANHPLERLV
ncbi:cyanamide hydratase [Microbacterium sp.]|uniref:cyanamide hydratase n=1 Tax=Microbacterium sp. TaxID=51671 RepID=UPI002FE37372